MSKVIALIYADTQIPAEIYAEVRRMKNAGLVDLIDLTEVEVKDNGKIKFEQAMTVPLVGSTSGLFLPALIGIIFFHPQHPVNDTVQRTLQEISLDQNFISTMTTEVSPRNSVLFLHVRNNNTAPLIKAMTEHGGRAVEMSITGGQEDKLRHLFKGQALPDPQYTMHI
ncbi:MAG: DUF1269 domain-containing protein [Bdellovibrionales bacterium]|nr:DUF1269 domain-containing protein [Bdellovibrionales bacterium]